MRHNYHFPKNSRILFMWFSFAAFCATITLIAKGRSSRTFTVVAEVDRLSDEEKYRQN